MTEYCEGGSLEDDVWKRSAIRQVLEDFLQVCEGVAYAHSKGVIHRDIKPANIFVRKDATLAVGDFGLCFFEDDGVRHTVTGEVVGSRSRITHQSLGMPGQTRFVRRATFIRLANCSTGC